jgi:hypothetical protein
MNTSPERYLSLIKRLSLRRGAVFGAILLVALFAFEIFNYSTTDYALTDMLGANLRFIGIRWATILSIAFCGIDFAGIARLFTPEQGRDEPAEVWYLFGAWLLAAAMNAILTWWGVAIAMSNHVLDSVQVMNPAVLMRVVPIFVAVMVWLIRVLIIGSISYAVNRIMGKGTAQNIPAVSVNHNAVSGNLRPQPQKIPAGFHPIPTTPKPEPVYSPISLSSLPSSPNTSPQAVSNPRL